MDLSMKMSKPPRERGSALMEFLISALILLFLCASAFGVIGEIQRTAGYQAEVQSVLNNLRIAMQTLQRYIRTAGNDPFACGAAGITIVSPAEFVVESDLTGSAGPSNPDKGDPDGDIADSGERVAIRHNLKTRTLEVSPSGGSAQVVANYISGLSLRYFGPEGEETSIGGEVRRISITVSAAGTQPDPQTHKIFAVELTSDMEISS
jgi:Tfp pilus assembly protein PilW